HVHLSETVEGNAGRVRYLAADARNLAVRVDAEERDRHALPARACARHVERAVVRVNRGVGDDVQVVGQLAPDYKARRHAALSVSALKNCFYFPALLKRLRHNRQHAPRSGPDHARRLAAYHRAALAQIARVVPIALDRHLAARYRRRRINTHNLPTRHHATTSDETWPHHTTCATRLSNVCGLRNSDCGFLKACLSSSRLELRAREKELRDSAAFINPHSAIRIPQLLV